MLSSTAGLRPVTGFGYFSAVKHLIEAIAATLREEAGFGIRMLTVEPGEFRTRAYAGFAKEPVQEIPDVYLPVLLSVRSVMIDQNGRQPGDPRRGA